MLSEFGPAPELSILNRHPKSLNGPPRLHELVPISSPTNAPAVDFLEDGSKRRTLAYHELHALSDTLARKITQALAGVKDASDIVPILLPQSPELYIAILAILKAGRAFCPMGLDVPQERLAFILKDVSANLVITDSTQTERLSYLPGIHALLVNEEISDPKDHADAKVSLLNPTQLAYVLYTSGSTGRPKAVSVSHRAVTQSLLAHDRHIPQFSRFLQFAAPTFDVSIFEIFFPLYRGCTVVGCTRTHMLSDLPRTITSLQVDAAELTPTVVSNLLRGRSSVPGLKLLLTIGEMLTRDVVEEYGGQSRKDSILWGMYGPTEAAIHCTLQPQFTSDFPVGNIGFPLDTVSAFIAAPLSESSVDSSIEVLPTGETGELVVGGPQIAEKYLNRADLTAVAFVKDMEFGYLYRTGDKARLNRDGTLECLGRIVSGQVKLRGQRVELGEVEQVILNINACYSAVVMVIDATLVAFCAVNSANTTKEFILARCGDLLPNYMVPTEVLLVQSMPQLASGKIDKKSLEAQYLRGHYESGVSAASSIGHPESHLAASIRKKLGGRDVRQDTPLDSISIDSLRSILIASTLREQGYFVTPIEILSTPRLTQLIENCEMKGKSKAAPAKLIHNTQMSVEQIPELREVQDDIQDILFCTSLQEAMLVETSTKPSAYCNWIELELEQPLTYPQVRAYLDSLAQKNEILRAGFLTTSSTSRSFIQVIWKDLMPSAVREVARFSRTYTLGSTEALLRPFNVQFIAGSHTSRLLFQIHHALYDGWSFDLLIHDLNQLVSNCTPKPRPQYREVLQYYLGLEDENISETKAYWTNLLQDFCPTPLPNLNGKIVSSKGLRSIRGEASIDAQFLYSRARDLSINPQVFFQTASAYIFGLYAGSSDIVIGTVTSGRTIPVTRIEDIIGPCIASLPFRLEISENMTIDELLHKTQKANRNMLQHCTLPLREITKVCGLQPGVRLFDILFVWQQSPISNDEEGLKLRVVDSADDLEFKVTLEFEPRDDRILYRITYDPSNIPEQQIIHFSNQIDQVVNHLLHYTHSQVGDVMKCFSSDTVSVANPEPEETQGSTQRGLSCAVEKWALKTPEMNAVVYGSLSNGVMQVQETLTYASLNARANQLAHTLLEHGVGDDQLVCIILEKSTDLYVSILAVLKIGCGYLPITPDTPIERTKRILTDAEVALCISHSSISVDLPQDTITLLDLDKIDLSHCSDRNLNVQYNGSRLAYAVFTSGSTGKPKGVLVTQNNLMSNLDYLSSIYPTTAHSRLLQSCSQAFDVSVFEIFFSWHVGICLCTATKDDLFYNFEAAIDKLKITHLSLTPTVAGMVDPIRVPNVKFLVTAGEALTENVRRKWAGKGLFQGYGPSETTNICTVRPYVTTDDMINNIGKSFPNTSTLVLAPCKDYILPRGAIGELCFGGSQVFRGYLKMPELNAEKIIDHPQYGRIYRSGDTGILLPDDSILSTGRIDDQVKIRGQRVELGEITSIALDHPAVLDSATLLLRHNHGAQNIACFWVPSDVSVATFKPLPSAKFYSTIMDIFETLSLRLPSYMVPSHLVPISQIPMTPQSKVDKRLLHSIFESLPLDWLESATFGQDTEDSIEVLSPSEQTIIEVLARTLDIRSADIRRTSSFFNLGVDSISAIRFAKGLRIVGYDQVSVSTILKNSSVKRLSSAIRNQTNQEIPVVGWNLDISNIFSSGWIDQIRSDFKNRGTQVEKVYPCTPLQEAMLSASPSESSSYCNTMVFRVNGQLDNLKKCWEHMIKRHEVLRTAFVATDNPHYAYAQVALAPTEMQWDWIQGSDDATTYFKDVLSNLLERNLPPIRLGIQTCEAFTKVVFSCHHALYDGSAISALLNEIQETYYNNHLPPTIKYELYLQHMINQDFKEADHFWATSFAGFEPTLFPNISNRVPESNSQTHIIEKTLQSSLSDSLAFCQSSKTSLISLVQASWVKLLHFCIGENDLCFGNVVSGRTLMEVDIERLVAPCFNTLPIRLNFDFGRSNSELCKQLHAFNIDSFPFQLTPLRRIQSKVLKDWGRLFDTLVILQQPTTPLDSSIWDLEHDIGEMDLPVVCEVFQDSQIDTLRLNLHYNDSLILEEDARLLAEIFDMALQSLIQHPSSSADDTVGFPSKLLSQSNMDWKNLGPAPSELLHSAFERNATKHPEALALDFMHAGGERTTMSFRVLNESANQVAHALTQRGIKMEDIVPVHMPKSPQFYVSILGILKAGAAFTPIHPDLPEERKRVMLSELSPQVILGLDDTLEWGELTTLLNVNDIADYSGENLTCRNISPTNGAYCLYTSGSTGVPKAVSMEHRAPVQTIESSRTLIPWNANSRLLQYAAITFDMCYYDCFLAWTFGFTLCAADQEVMLNDLTNTINTLNVDLLDLTPSIATSLHRNEVPAVKWLYCIGEAMPTKIIKEWKGACVNSYGPTETAFCTTIFPTNENIKASIIGQPFRSTSFAVFPPHGDRPIPVLGVGELYIGGAQLAREYFKKPELSDDSFVQKCGQRFYKSGDMVRMLSDSTFEFLGRTDDQVKMRGLRVELGEINHVLQECDGTITTVNTQILRKETEAKEQLVSFLVPSLQVNEEKRFEIRKKAKEAALDRLPAYMVPQFFIFVDKIPKSMAGKVDKKALAQIFRDAEELQPRTRGGDTESYTHDWSEIESRIRDTFAKFSNTAIDDITPWTTIYQLGLDSISAVQIASRLRRQNLHSNASDIMKYVNCENLARHLTRTKQVTRAKTETFDLDSFERKHRSEIVQACHIRDGDIQAIRPCTSLQSGMLSQFISNNGDVYFNHLRLRLNPSVDFRRMKNAWLATMQKHQILRTGFAYVKDGKTSFAMIQYRIEAIEIPWDDKTYQASSTVDKWLEKSRQEAARRLHRPPWRVRCIEKDGNWHLDLALLHAIFDAQSLRLIFNDVTNAYNDVSVGGATPLDPILCSILESSLTKNAQDINFWKQLGTVATPTRFPNLASLRHDPLPPAIVNKIASRPLAELYAGCRRSNISLQVAAMSSWATLLATYTGETSATFGVILSGRNADDSTDVVFPCITTVPFVCKISESKEEVLKQTMDLNADIQQHQFTPLHEIQRLMGHSSEPLFDSIFAFQKLSNSDIEHDPWVIVEENATTEYPVSIELEPKGEQLKYRLTFLPHLVPREQAEVILEQLDHLMEEYVFFDDTDDDSYNPGIYSVTPAKEAALHSEARLLHEMVEVTASNYPERVALEFAISLRNGVYSSRNWTYAELNAEGSRIANLLLSYNAHPGDIVGVSFDKCPEASFATLGILKAGCAFVALDPTAPSARKAFIVKDSSAKIVLSMKAQSTNLNENVQATVLNLDEVDIRHFSEETPSLERMIDPQDRSYCLYTSGTTGTPKGCELTHENAVQAMMAFQRLFEGHWDEHSRWLQFASFHFDVSVLEQYWSWSVGICVVSAPRDLIFEDLATSINTLGITHIDLTPSLARILHPDDVPSLCKGVFITGGESLKQEILDVWGPKSVIYNGYGPTEATIGVTMYPRVPANGKPSNIGPQFDNVGSYVLRPGSDMPVLRGGVGELCVSGKLVGKGYLNRPDLTESAFPVLPRFNERVYRTGDLVRILHNGCFEFLGRADDQVKLRGQRLEIGEINTVIKQSGITVADVTTLVLKHPNQQKEQLVAFVVLEANVRGKPEIVLEKTDELAAAKQICEEKLPSYMVPTHFVALTAMPLNVNNKTDARKLKEMYAELSPKDLQMLSSASSFQSKDEKWSKQEEKIRATLNDILDIKNIEFGKDVSFFELGMDSISVIGVSRALKQARFSKAAASVVMKNATVRRLGKVLSDKNGVANDRGSVLAAHQAITAVQHRHRQSVAETLFMDARNIEALAPCTPLQQGMIARSYDSDSGLYFNAFRFSLSNEVSLIQLKKAWGIVLSSTQILRTVFVNTDDGFLQAALREAALRFESVFIDDSDKLDERLEDKRMEWVQRNHPVIKTPFEIILVETTERKILIIHIFHALYDGISIELAFNHVWDAYNGHEIQPGPSFQSALPYGPLRDAEGARVFWEKHLDNTSFKPLPALIDKPDKALIHVSRTFDNLNNLETTRRRLNVTPQAFAQACWVKTLHQYIEGTVTLGMIVSGRSIDFEGADKVNGPLFNTIPFQYLPKQGETWSSLVKSAHDFNVAANPFQHTPLRNIMKWSKRSPSQPLFETLFVYQVANGDETCMKNQFWELVDGETEADYPLAIEVEQRGGDGLKITLVAQGHIADEDKVHEMLEQFEDALRQAMSEPDAGVGINPEDGMSITASTVPQHKNTGQHSLDEAKDFQWTANATILREEIGQLANDDPSNIKEMTSIFELGLDSIDAIKLSSKLKKRGIDLPVSNIMRNLTIVKMTQHISTEDRKPIARPSDMVYQSHKRRLKSYLKRHDLAKDVENIMPLTPLQEAMVAEMIASDYTRYYNHDVLKLAPNVDAEKLQKAFLDVVSQSPILRTSFIQVDDPNIASSFAQVIHRRPHAFAETTKADEEPDFPDIFETMRQKAIHTSKLCPLFYIEIIQAPKQQTYILLSIAHALYDGWSLGLLHQDVDQAYNGQLKTRPSYERTLIEILTTSGPDALAFWRDYLSDATPCLFPRETGFGDEESHTVHRKEQTSRILLRDLTAFAKKVNISLQTLGQTVYALVISSYTQSMDVTFGSVLSGRDDDERAKLLFPTMNTVAIRAILHGTRREMLQYVQDNFSNIKQWQHFPLRKALSLAGVQGALFESLFIYQKSMVSDKAQDKLYESITGQSDVEYPVCVEMEIVNDELVWRCAVKGEIFNEEGAQELLHRLDEVMESIMERPDAETIEFTEEGTVVCGLPAFEKETLQDTTTENGEEQEHDLETINSTTTKTIREVLAFSSKISEEEIAEGMTIFHIGLDSISAIKVSSLLRKRGIILSVGEMLKAGTVEKMARIADERSTDKDTNEDDPKVVIDEALSGIDRAAILRRASIQDKDVEAFLPATAAQVYMLSMWLNSHGALFYPVFAYHVCGSITLESLHAAWMALVKANPILRTCLYATKDTNTPYVQTVLRQTGSEDVFHDVSGWTEETVTMELEKYAIMQPYVHLFASRDSGGWKIRLQIHHALYDGVSLSLLMQQLQDLCNNTDIPQLTSLTFEKYIASSSAPSAQDDRKFFWTKYLRNFEQAQQHLPQPHPAPKSKIEIFSPGLIPDIRRIETYARHHGVSTQAIFLAIVSKLYARLTSAPTNHDIVIGIYLANRSHNITHLAQAPIPTVNLVPLRVSLPLETDVLDIAAQIQYDIQEISNVVHAGVAVWEIDQWTGVKVDCWVNFLKLPGGRGDEDVDSEVLGEGVRIVESGEGRWDKKVLRVIGLETASKVKKEMVCEHVNGSYLHSLDVEATIRNNALDVGIFAPEDMIRLSPGEELMKDLREGLEGLTEERNEGLGG